jgi:hypothetical protein
VAPLVHWSEFTQAGTCSRHQGIKLALDSALTSNRLSRAPSTLTEFEAAALLRDALLGFHALTRFLGLLFPVTEDMVALTAMNNPLVWVHPDFYRCEIITDMEPPQSEPAFVRAVADLVRPHTLRHALPDPLEQELAKAPDL